MFVLVARSDLCCAAALMPENSFRIELRYSSFLVVRYLLCGRDRPADTASDPPLCACFVHHARRTPRQRSSKKNHGAAEIKHETVENLLYARSSRYWAPFLLFG